MFELKYGAKNSQNIETNHKVVDLFTSRIPIIPISSCLKSYVKEKVRLRKIGKPMHDEFDLLVGVTTI